MDAESIYQALFGLASGLAWPLATVAGAGGG